MRRSIMVTSASSSIARRRTAGKRSLRPTYPPKPEGYEEYDLWGRRSSGAPRASGPSSRRSPTSQASSGAERSPAACSAPPIMGRVWQMLRSLWDHPKRSEWNGGGADLPGIHSICRRSAQFPSASGSQSRPAASGSPEMPARLGRSAARACVPIHVPPERRTIPIAQDVHCLAQCPAAPERMWVQHHNGIFVSSDEGRTSPRSPASSRRPSAFRSSCIPTIPTPPGSFPKSRTRSASRATAAGGDAHSRRRQHFRVPVNGLPQSHAYDVVYRHALALDDTGERLAFGSTTGGLWVSEDLGDQLDVCHAHSAANLRRALRMT